MKSETNANAATEKTQTLPVSQQKSSQTIARFLRFYHLISFYYFCKSNLSVATQPIQETFGYSRQCRMGVILTSASLVYALGQFINGNLTDRFGAKKLFFIGAIGAVVWNFLFGFSSTFVLFFITWIGNIYFLSMGWAPSMKLLFSWFPQNRWGFFSGISNAFCFLAAPS